MRVNKYISETGYCSRREADALIQAGKVAVNGAIAQLGTQVEEGAKVLINGRPIGFKPQPVYIALNKPVGITSTTDTDVKGNIVGFVNHPQRIFPIGRLDKDSQGLIILTNDGDIVNKLLRAENSHDKEYIVTVDKIITDEFLRGMSSGVHILGTKTLPCRTSRISSHIFRIILTQGLNRQIRRMCEVFGYEVERLERIRIMNIKLGNLPLGAWRDLTNRELRELFASLGHQPRSINAAKTEKAERIKVQQTKPLHGKRPGRR